MMRNHVPGGVPQGGEAGLDIATGLLTKEAWNNQLERRIRDAESGFGDEFGVIYLDITGLKRLNDGLGHEAGDVFIAETGNILTNKLRTGDEDGDVITHSRSYVIGDFVVGHIGGDEFAVLVGLKPEEKDPEFRQEERRNAKIEAEERLDIVVNRLRDSVARLIKGQSEEVKKLNIDIAVGGATWQRGMDASALKSAADHAMLLHKKEQYEAIDSNLPRRKRLARHLGRRLLRYSDVDSRSIL